jgi:DNA-binding NarL/FixJ family response regulator
VRTITTLSSLPRVILVEDNEISLELLRRALHGSFEVVGAFRSVAEARVKSPPLKPDVVLVDLNLEGIRDGLDLIRWFAVELPGVVILAVTGEWSLESLREVMAAGARGHIVKPFKKDELLASLSLQLVMEREASQGGPRRAQELWSLVPSSPDLDQTTFSCSLAATLVKQGHRVVLVDLAPGRSLASHLFGEAEAHPTLQEVLESLDLMRPSMLLETLQETPAGFQVLPLGEEPLDPHVTLSMLLAFSDLVDYLLVDIPFSLRSQWHDLLPLSRRVLVTGGGSESSLAEMRTQLEVLGAEDLDQRLVPVLLPSEDQETSEEAFLSLLGGLPLRVGNAMPRISSGALSATETEEYSLQLEQLTMPLLRAPVVRKMVKTLSAPPSGPGFEGPDWVGKILTLPFRRPKNGRVGALPRSALGDEVVSAAGA